MTFRRRLNEKWIKLAALALIIGAVVYPMASPMAANTGQPVDNDANAIMWGGAYDKSAWVNKVAHGDGHNSAQNLQQIYYNEGRGITWANFIAPSTMEGEVTKDGRVIVNGLVVATGAQSVGRSNMAGSHQSGSVWERSTSVSFTSNALPAFVNMEGGVFRYAIIKSCGNPVRANPVPYATPTPVPAATATPAPTAPPAPTATPKPAATPVPTATPQPQCACIQLNPSLPDQANKPATFRFTAVGWASNTPITGYHFTFSDGSAPADTPANTPYVDHTFPVGTWKVTAQVRTAHGVTAVNEACTATAVVHPSATPAPTATPIPTTTPAPTATPKPTATPTPIHAPASTPASTPPPTGSGQVLGATLPSTGPEAAALGSLVGLSAIGLASRAYVRSRKSLQVSLRRKSSR